MAMRGWDPWREMMRMQNELSRLFQRTFGPAPEEEALWMPAVDISQEGNMLKVRVDLPDVDPNNIDISVADNTLRVSGKRERKEEIKKENYFRAERTYGEFERLVELPEPVKTENVEATYKNGVLEIDLPIAEEKKGKEIKVKVA